MKRSRWDAYEHALQDSMVTLLTREGHAEPLLTPLPLPPVLFKVREVAPKLPAGPLTPAELAADVTYTRVEFLRTTLVDSAGCLIYVERDSFYNG